MDRARVTTAMLVVLWGFGVMWGPAQAGGRCCGDCNGNNEVTIDEIVKAVNRALDGCQDDRACAQPGAPRFPASGQTTAYGPGSDGDVKVGAALSYTDNADGTITDRNTGLMWEKKDDSGGIHDKDNTYSWGMASEPYTMNGTMVTAFLATLNRPPCFAGHCDWRIPNVKELQSIVGYESAYPEPTVDAAFHNAAGCTGCADVTRPSCRCTASFYCWSSTTNRSNASIAWSVNFIYGDVFLGNKSNEYAVRAVRGGW